MISSPIPRISAAKKKPRPSSIRLKFMPSMGSQSTPAVTTSPASTAGKLVKSPTRAARVTVNVTPAQAERPAEFIIPGNKAPRKGRATIRKRDTRTPDLSACAVLHCWGKFSGFSRRTGKFYCKFVTSVAAIARPGRQTKKCDAREVCICETKFRPAGLAAPHLLSSLRQESRATLWRRWRCRCSGGGPTMRYHRPAAQHGRA